MSDALDNAQLRRLARTILNNPSASARKAALLEIRKTDHPQVIELLERVIKGDKDAEVRDLASNLLSKHRIQSMLDAGTFEEPVSVSDREPPAKTEYTPPPLPPEFQAIDHDYSSEFDDVVDLEYHTVADETAWTCRFCDTKNKGGHYCDSCGAHRDDTEVVEPTVALDPDFNLKGHVFLLHTTNRKMLSGDKPASFRRGGMGMGCFMLFMVPFILAGLVVGYMALREWQHYQLLEREGVLADGMFVSRRYDSDDDGTSYYATYRFQAGDSSYETEDSVNREIYNRVEPGAPVRVIYAPSNPQVSRLEGADGLSEAVGITVFTVFWNLISWGIFLGMFIAFSRDKRLAREGEMVAGKLLSASGRKDSDGDFQLKVEYRFVTPDTEEAVVKTESAQRNDLKRSDLPAKGTPIVVLYRNRTHFRMM